MSIAEVPALSLLSTVVPHRTWDDGDSGFTCLQSSDASEPPEEDVQLAGADLHSSTILFFPQNTDKILKKYTSEYSIPITHQNTLEYIQNTVRRTGPRYVDHIFLDSADELRFPDAASQLPAGSIHQFSFG